jgi:signal transduction histidine kinase/DNA-binding response OmpR family regulator
MVFASYIFGRNIERVHLYREAENMFENIESRLNAEMREYDTMIGIVSETIKAIIMRGGNIDEVNEYITDITNYARSEERIHGFVTVFTMYDVFGGQFYAGMGWVPPPDYVIEERPWYKTAAVSGEETVVGEPYVDMAVQEAAITYIRNIFDNNGKRLAIVCIDVLLDGIYRFSSQDQSGGVNTWMLFDNKLNIIAHPNPEFIGLSMSEAPSGIANFAADLKQGLPVIGQRFVTNPGETKILSIRNIDNGWYLGVSTPVNNYYSNVQSIQWFLILLGLVMATALSFILIQIIRARRRAELRTQIALENSQKKTEKIQVVSEAHRNLQTILEMIPVGVRILGLDDMALLYANKAALDIFNCSSFEEQVAGHNGFEFMPEFQPDGRSTAEVVNELFLTDFGTVEMQCIRLGGQPFLARITSCTIDYEGKKASLAVIEDMTEEKEYQEMLKNTALKEQEANQLKSRFLATVSHEIRTPMKAIMGVAETQLYNDHPSDTEEAFSTIYDSGSLLLNIINDILDMSKIEAGKLEIVPYKYDIPSLINDTIQLNRLRYESRPIDFNLLIDENTPFNLYGDELRIKQILNNLLSNAYKYTDKGNVELYVSSESEKESLDITLIIRVSDTGQGMTEEQIERLFEEYTRFNVEYNRNVIGAGLGMSITKRLIEMMNGDILVESIPGNGSVFTVRLPQKRIGSQACGKDLANKLQQFNFHNLSKSRKTKIMREYMPYGSVLVVDDVESNLYVARGMLVPYGLNIDTAESALEAIEKIKDGNIYNVIFMDHMMPRMDGVEAVKIIRGMGYTHPIVALTANALAGQSEMFIANGFDGYISKPIDSRELNAVLNNFIRDKQPLEVLEAARKERVIKKNAIVYKMLSDEEYRKVFLKDTKKTVDVLEKIYPKLNDVSEEEINLFVITVHGIKTTLKNIGETDISEAAFNLEQAGRSRVIDVLLRDTPEFIVSLKKMIMEFSPPEEVYPDNYPVEISDVDVKYLRERLLAIITACAAFNRDSAKNAMEEIKQMVWPHEITKGLDAITEHLLHSAFRKASDVADSMLK